MRRELIDPQKRMKRRNSKLNIQPLNMENIIVQQAHVEEDKAFAVVEVVVVEGEEEEMIDTCNQ